MFDRDSIDLRTAFDLLDRDQDGHVTPEELQFMLRNLGIHVRDELIDDLLREASRTGQQTSWIDT
uniref:EF-hand domain-containing protein n=1 Tax=Anopheles epiroticus TaxID=199890 RepID=A0A182PB54_9DIPT